MRTLICLVMAALSVSAAPAPQARPEPFVPAGVWYGGGTVQPPLAVREPALEKEAWRRDLTAIRTLGFNSITTWVDWAGAEPERGRYQFAALEQMLSLADEIGLKVIVHVFTDAAPDWLGRRHADARYVSPGAPGRGESGPAGFCADHPGVRGDRLAFITAATRAAAAHGSFHAVALRADQYIAHSRPSSDPAAACRCVHTAARLREWAVRKYGPRDTPLIAQQAFEADTRPADLKAAAAAARSGGAGTVISYPPDERTQRQDAWGMAAAVDHYGARIVPKAGAQAWTPAQLMSMFDRMNAVSQGRGWWLGDLQAGDGSPAASVTAADLRLWGWASYSRGARAIVYGRGAWSGMAGKDGVATERGKAAGELAGNLTRNVRLFSRMRPRPALVAIYSPDATLPAGNALAPAGLAASSLEFYRIMFEQNIQVDFIRPEDVLAGAVSRYRVVHVGSARSLAQPVEAVLDAYVRVGGTLIRDGAAGAPPGAEGLRRAVAAAGVKPDIAIEGAAGLVEARFLESPDAFLLLAVNHSDAPQTVTMHFSPETPEAIWQNMETGASVHFVQGAAGPTYRHTFAARDVMLLVRGKRLR